MGKDARRDSMRVRVMSRNWRDTTARTAVRYRLEHICVIFHLCRLSCISRPRGQPAIQLRQTETKSHRTHHFKGLDNWKLDVPQSYFSESWPSCPVAVLWLFGSTVIIKLPKNSRFNHQRPTTGNACSLPIIPSKSAQQLSVYSRHIEYHIRFQQVQASFVNSRT